MKKYFYTAFCFVAGLLTYVTLAMPSYTIAGFSASGYDILKLDSEALKTIESLSLYKTLSIIMLVLGGLAMAFAVVKLLVDLKVLKLKECYFNLASGIVVGVLTAFSAFATVAVCGFTETYSCKLGAGAIVNVLFMSLLLVGIVLLIVIKERTKAPQAKPEK